MDVQLKLTALLQPAAAIASGQAGASSAGKEDLESKTAGVQRVR